MQLQEHKRSSDLHSQTTGGSHQLTGPALVHHGAQGILTCYLLLW